MNNNNNNSNNNNNIISSRNGNGTTQACAACKYQRRKCGPSCILAPYFPHDRQKQFLNAHKLFGVGKITNMIKNVPPPLRDATMSTIIYQSDMRAHDPVGGCYRYIQQLQSIYDFHQAELHLIRQHLAFYRAASSSSSSSSSNHHHYNNNDHIINNNNDDASLNIINQFNQFNQMNHHQQQHFVDEQMNINMLPQPQQQMQPQYVEDVIINPNYVPLQEDLNMWVNSIPLSPLTLEDNKKVEEEENEEIVGDDHESDQKPVYDLINEMNSLDTRSNSGHQ